MEGFILLTEASLGILWFPDSHWGNLLLKGIGPSFLSFRFLFRFVEKIQPHFCSLPFGSLSFCLSVHEPASLTINNVRSGVGSCGGHQKILGWEFCHPRKTFLKTLQTTSYSRNTLLWPCAECILLTKNNNYQSSIIVFLKIWPCRKEEQVLIYWPWLLMVT